MDLERAFIFPLKSNRKVARSEADKEPGRFERVDALEMEADTVRALYLREVPFPLLFSKQVFKADVQSANEDGSSGELYVASSDLALTSGQMQTCHKRRWKVEAYHKL